MFSRLLFPGINPELNNRKITEEYPNIFGKISDTL